MCAVFQQNGRDIILDLSSVTAIDAAGIGALVSLQAAGIYVRLVSPSFAVYRILRLIGLDSVFEISEPECSKELTVCSASLDDGGDAALATAPTQATNEP